MKCEDCGTGSAAWDGFHAAWLCLSCRTRADAYFYEYDADVYSDDEYWYD